MTGRVLIVEDHELLAQSLAVALGSGGLDVQHCKPLDADAVLDAVGDLRPDLVLLDLDLGEGVGSSVPLIPRITALGARVVVVTGIEARHRLGECIEAGATGVLGKARPFDELVATVHRALDGAPLMDDAQRDALLADLRRHRDDHRALREGLARLTPREEDVLAALMDGKPADAIAREAVVSVSTVRSQIRSLLTKLGVNSQLSAVALARRAGWRRP